MEACLRKAAVHGPRPLGDARAEPGASSLPALPSSPRPRTDPPPPGYSGRGRGRSHVRRARGANRHLARSGRACLTLVMSQSGRGGVALPPHAPSRGPLCCAPPPRHCAANGKAGSARTRTRGRGRAGARRGVGGREGAGRSGPAWGLGPRSWESRRLLRKDRREVQLPLPPSPLEKRLLPLPCPVRIPSPQRRTAPSGIPKL